MAERYSNMDRVVGYNFLLSALGEGRGAGEDRGNAFPRSDAEDMSRGARFIPGDVTVARRRGEKVDFVTHCSPNCWYWKMPDGTRIYHYDPVTYELIGKRNGHELVEHKYGFRFENGPGPCPDCQNPHTSGERVKP